MAFPRMIRCENTHHESVGSVDDASRTHTTGATVMCHVCGEEIELNGRDNQHVVNCNGCHEATPIRPAPDGVKYVRCPCNCLLICEVASTRIACPRGNCRRIITLGHREPQGSAIRALASSCRVQCVHCSEIFDTLSNYLARCPHCKKKFVFFLLFTYFSLSRGIPAMLEREKTKGRDWFDLPATELTEEAKADLELLQMRAAIDPLAFYLRNDRNVLPKYFQVGRVVDAPQDFYSSRMTKKERKRTMLDELLNDQRLTQSKREKMFMVVIALLPKYKRSFNSSSTPRAMNVTIHS